MGAGTMNVGLGGVCNSATAFDDETWLCKFSADPGTIRADFANSIDANAVHGSDSETSAVREINYFFNEEEIVSK